MALARLQGSWDIHWRQMLSLGATVIFWGPRVMGRGWLVLWTKQNTKKDRWSSSTVRDEMLPQPHSKHSQRRTCFIFSLSQCLTDPRLGSESLCMPILIIYIILRGREEGEEAPIQRPGKCKHQHLLIHECVGPPPPLHSLSGWI